MISLQTYIINRFIISTLSRSVQNYFSIHNLSNVPNKMFELKIFGGSKGGSTILSHERGLEYEEICKQLGDKALEKGTYYIEQNGRLVSENHTGLLEGKATLLPRILGGKGGFGSMLRAIGAQIEKTTNREACRDLSGRRLRDINEEKRLKAWIEKQESREEEEVARKKRKLEKLCAVPKHEFSDKKYEAERSALTDRAADALEQGIKTAAAAAEVEEQEKRAKLAAKKVGRKTILDDEFNSDELDSSDDSDDPDNANPPKKLATEAKNSSSECEGSSNESHSAAAGSSRSLDDNSESTSLDGPLIDPNVKKNSAKRLTA